MTDEQHTVKVGRCVDGLFSVANTLAQLMEWPSEDIPRLCVSAGAQMFYAVLDTFERRSSSGQMDPKQVELGRAAVRACGLSVLRAMEETKAHIEAELAKIEPPSTVKLN